jgi:DNA polymerase-3 subunit alpha/error-prone DNA polymerase
MTLEDETGVANAIVWTKVFDTYRAVVMGARLVKISGKLQSASGVIHVVVEHIEDMTHVLGLLQKEVRRFGANERSDEVLRPTVDQRQKKLAMQLARAREKAAFSKLQQQDEAAETARVMPRGRNFH